jgi:hypothetical protein
MVSDIHQVCRMVLTVVREASMRAGKMIIANYSNKAIDLLLPELEKGMLDASWRIRVGLTLQRIRISLTRSNRLSPLPENCCTRSQVSAAKSSLRMKKLQRILPTTLERLCSKLLDKTSVIGCWLLCTSSVKMRSVSFVRPLYISGRHWCRVSSASFRVNCRSHQIPRGRLAKSYRC